MPKLVGENLVRLRGAIQNIGDTNAVIKSALDATSLYFESYLNTTFAEETQTDLFWLDDGEMPFSGPFAQLKLRKGFMKAGAILLVEYAPNLENFDTQKIVVKPSQLVVKESDGLISLTGISLNKNYIKVTYTAGWPTQVPVAEIQTVVIGGPLVTANQISLTIDGVLISTVFNTDSNTTLATLATLIQNEPGVLSAVVTDAGLGTSDDRIITVTAATAGVPVVLTALSITLGTSQSSFVVVPLVANQVADSSLYDVSLVPEWLKEAAIGYALIVMANQNLAKLQEGSTEQAQNQIRQIWNHLNMIAEPHNRNFGWATSPLIL